MTCAPVGSVAIVAPSTTTTPGTSRAPSNTRTFVTANFAGWLGMQLPRSPSAGHYVQVDACRILGPPGDVLVRPDEQVLIPPRKAVGCGTHRQRDAAFARPCDDARGVCAGRAKEREPAAEHVVQRPTVRQPRVRQPTSRLGRRDIAAQ